MPTIIVMCGLPGSGKSTYSKKLEEKGYIIHSSDAIRAELGDVQDQSKNKEVFAILHKRIIADLQEGKNVVYDATNLIKKQRILFLKKLEGILCEKICMVVNTPCDICIAQNLKRDRKVPVEVIEKMNRNFEFPTCIEGFNKITEC